ncbi:unnamed protein product, partial [Prunus brigantina]
TPSRLLRYPVIVTSSFSPSNSISSLLRYPQSPLTLSCYTQSQSLSHPSHLQHLSSSPISSLCSISVIIYSYTLKEREPWKSSSSLRRAIGVPLLTFVVSILFPNGFLFLVIVVLQVRLFHLGFQFIR